MKCVYPRSCGLTHFKLESDSDNPAHSLTPVLTIFGSARWMLFAAVVGVTWREDNDSDRPPSAQWTCRKHTGLRVVIHSGKLIAECFSVTRKDKFAQGIR